MSVGPRRYLDNRVGQEVIDPVDKHAERSPDAPKRLSDVGEHHDWRGRLNRRSYCQAVLTSTVNVFWTVVELGAKRTS
jgi:hypothetical protein